MNRVTLGKTNLQVSRISLGTAEIGFNYGIGERPLLDTGRADSFLKQGLELGINFFDTANYYGEAEKRLGQSGLTRETGVVIETKCAQFLEKGEYFSDKEIEDKIRAQVADSLSKLKLSILDILMLHGPSQEQLADGKLIKIMHKLKQEKLIRFLGISSRGEENALAALNTDIDVLQVAYSVLDQRMAKHVFPLAQNLGVGIVSRSTLLKGALTPLRHQLPEKLLPLKLQADKINQLAEENHMDLPTLAIRFALSNHYIASVLIGTNKIDNLQKAVLASEAGPLPEKILHQLEKLQLTDLEQIDPAKWPPLK